MTTSRDTTARIWDTATGEQRTVLSGRTSWMTAVAIAPDGSWLAAGDDTTARIWDAATGRQRAVLTGHADRVEAVAIAPDGSWLATASGGTLRVWDRATGKARAVMRVDGRLHDCSWSSSGRLLAAAGEAGLYYFTFSP